MFRFPCRFPFFINFSSFKSDTENNANFDAVSSERGNSVMPFSKEGTILIKKNLHEYKGYNAWHFITEFPDKGWMKNSINGEVKKVWNS